MITIKKDKPENVELLQAIGSRDLETSREAMKVLAALVQDVAQDVLHESNDIEAFYREMEMTEFERPTIPLADFHDSDNPDEIRVSFSSKPGDLASSLITGMEDFPVQFYNIEGAYHMRKKYLRSAQVNHVETAIQRLFDEVIFRSKMQAIQPILKSLAQAQTDSKYHVIRSNTAGQLGMADFNRLRTLAARIVTSGLGGTPKGPRGVTDLLVSPEVMEEIRGMSYNPVNTRGVPDSAESTAIAAPDSVREELFRSAGVSSFSGVNLIELNELGVGQIFNTFFDQFAGSLQYANNGEASGSSSTSVFDGTSEELILGINRSSSVKNGLLKVGLIDSESKKVFNVRPDTQFLEKEDKIGFYGTQELSYLSVEPKTVFGIVM